MTKSKQLLGKHHPCTLASIRNLADTYRSQGRWDEAMALDDEADESIGQDDPLDQ